MKLMTHIGLLLLISSLTATAANSDQLMKRANRYFQVLPNTMPGSENDTAEKISLGKQLFFDTRLSVNNSQSCASCHRLNDGLAGVDNLGTSPGALGKLGTRNSPTVLNAGLQRLQFWDGRAPDLVEQAKGPILNPIEMAMPDEHSVEQKISNIKEYTAAFRKAFPDRQPALSYQTIAEAIAAFERTLITPSRFDDFLRGDSTALNEDERKGLAAFIRHRCVSCHDGVLIGGDSLEKLGQENPYENQTDQGLYQVSQQEEDRMVFKVSSLRNVALTAPYFHDGRVNSLEEAISLMARLQLGKTLRQKDIRYISHFLHALTDKNREKQ
ncbi:MAG: c-type cytochrome [Gammaproteobacteria bacterium]|nr:c-type cytochrome [Gammaproteobacteria bacterium]